MRSNLRCDEEIYLIQIVYMPGKEDEYSINKDNENIIIKLYGFSRSSYCLLVSLAIVCCVFGVKHKQYDYEIMILQRTFKMRTFSINHLSICSSLYTVYNSSSPWIKQSGIFKQSPLNMNIAFASVYCFPLHQPRSEGKNSTRAEIIMYKHDSNTKFIIDCFNVTLSVVYIYRIVLGGNIHVQKPPSSFEGVSVVAQHRYSMSARNTVINLLRVMAKENHG